VFNTAINATTNRDSINSFVTADDTIRLENTGTGLFMALTTLGTLSAAARIQFATLSAFPVITAVDFVVI
jgi:hypothetical protein